MEQIIEEYYEKYNFPSIEKLFKILKDDGFNIKKNEIKEYLSQQTEQEQLKIKKPKKKKQGHIIALTYKENAQMDIYDMSKYKSTNKNYKYILVLIDVFTRKVWAYPLKKKNSNDVLQGLLTIFEEYVPGSITSDSDSSFLSESVQQLLNDKNIYHDVIIASNDHKALGIVDRFALNVKTTLTKLFLRNRNTVWIDSINKIIDNYNNTPHSSILNLTPNEATKPIYQADLAYLNKMKSTNKKITSDLKVDDFVRIRINKTFRKGTEPRYTDDVYRVVNVNGKRITLDNDKIYIDSELIKTNNTNNEENVVNQTLKQNSKEQKIKKSGVDEKNIIDKRTRSK